MFVVIYRWRIKPEHETDFRQAWSRITALHVERSKSGGSALFRAEDGGWVGVARWPSLETYAAALDAGVLDPEASATMAAAIVDRQPTVQLECVEDQWLFPMPADESMPAPG